MIDTTLQTIAQELNSYFKRKYQLQENKVLLTSLIGESGTIPKENKNKVILSLVNIAQESTHQYSPTYQASESNDSKLNPPLNFNIDLLFTPVFDDYKEALKFLSATLQFFQAKTIFTPQNTPGLPENIQRLSFNLVTLNYNELQNLWTTLGANYSPSVLYKVRMFSLDDSTELEIKEIPSIKDVNTEK
jgi:hypothetical protein